jgi:hypothetical protein
MARKLKTKGLAYWTKKLDTVFSQYVRLKNADKNGMVKCYTCGALRHYKCLDAGHYHDRKWMGIRWNVDNVRPQCYYCNKFRQGRGPDFRKNLIMEIGEERVEELFYLRLFEWTPDELETQYHHYFNEVKRLKKEKELR